MSPERHFYIVSPSWEEIEPVLDDGSGPLVTVTDVVSVSASTKREAIRLGVKLMEHYPKIARQDGRNPFSGVKAESALCPHGVCHCDLKECDLSPGVDYCEACLREHDPELAAIRDREVVG